MAKTDVSNSTNFTRIAAEATQTYKNTELLLREIFRDPPIVPYKRARSLKIYYFEQNIQSGYYTWMIGVV